MLKNILIKTAELINRDDILSSLKKINSIDEINNDNLSNDITKMISYSNFQSTPTKIISVKTISNFNTLFSINSTFITTNAPNQTYLINYNYLPNELKNFDDCLEIPFGFNIKIICYGIASEFLASKDQYDKSEFWKNRYLYEIFKLKIKKERRLKSTFIK